MYNTAGLNIPIQQQQTSKYPSSFGSSFVSESSYGNSFLSQVYENKARRISQSHKKNFQLSTTLLQPQQNYQSKDSFFQEYLVDNAYQYVQAKQDNLQCDLVQKYQNVLQQMKNIKEFDDNFQQGIPVFLESSYGNQQQQILSSSQDFKLFKSKQDQYNIFSRDLVIQSYLINKAAFQLYQNNPCKEYLETAQILVELNADEECVACALLLGVASIPGFDMDILKKLDIDPLIIKNLKNLKTLESIGDIYSKYSFSDEEMQKLIAVFHSLGDQRAVLIKLAERLQLVRTLKSCSPQYQKQISEETFSLYVPLAGRLGLRYLKAQLQDGCLEYCAHLPGMQQLKHVYDYSEGQHFVQSCIEKFERQLKEDQEVGSKTVLTAGRSKSYYSILQKQETKSCKFEDIHDVYGLRIVVEDKTTCYRVCRLVSQLWKVENIKDYIRFPKQNGYQSLHVTAVCPDGRKLDIQIRTVKQNFLAEFGVQAHWRYKEKIVRQEMQVQQSVSWCRYVISWLMDIQENTYQSSLPQNKLKDSTIELAHNCRFPEHSKDCKFAKYVKDQGLVPDPSYSDGQLYFVTIKDSVAQVQQCMSGHSIDDFLRDSCGRYWQLQYLVQIKNRQVTSNDDNFFDYKVKAGDIIEIKAMESNVQYISKMDEVFHNDDVTSGNDEFVFI